MKKVTLSKFISNLKEFKDNPMKVYKPIIVEVIYAVLWQMAKHQILDTGQGRYLIISKFAEKYGIPYEDLNSAYYNYWHNTELENRKWGNNTSNSDLKEATYKDKYKLNIYIRDDGVYSQEYANMDGVFNGKHYPSDKPTESPTNRDNSPFRPRHITYVSDMFNSGNYGSIEKLNISKLVNDLSVYIEKQLFK